jgi:hypothetical protein
MPDRESPKKNELDWHQASDWRNPKAQKAKTI